MSRNGADARRPSFGIMYEDNEVPRVESAWLSGRYSSGMATERAVERHLKLTPLTADESWPRRPVATPPFTPRSNLLTAQLEPHPRLWEVSALLRTRSFKRVTWPHRRKERWQDVAIAPPAPRVT